MGAAWRSFHAQYFHAASLIFRYLSRFLYNLAGFQSNIREIKDKFPAKTCRSAFLAFSKFFVEIAWIFSKHFLGCSHIFSNVHGSAQRILQVAWKFYKIFPCMLPVFSMFFKTLQCMHGCNMENFPACSTRVLKSIHNIMRDKK